MTFRGAVLAVAALSLLVLAFGACFGDGRALAAGAIGFLPGFFLALRQEQPPR